MLSLKRTERNADDGEEGEGDWPFSWLLGNEEVEAFPSESVEVEMVLHVVGDADETEESSLHGLGAALASVRRWARRESEFAATVIVVRSCPRWHLEDSARVVSPSPATVG